MAITKKSLISNSDGKFSNPSVANLSAANKLRAASANTLVPKTGALVPKTKLY